MRIACKAYKSLPLGSAHLQPHLSARFAAETCATPHRLKSEHTTIKRKVAMQLGYVGTSFRGLQVQRDGEGCTAVEDVLERALVSAGAILPSNSGASHKMGWSRSSRTDKGVHSLSTVVGFKMECKEGYFERDAEGQEMASAINAHLPKEVRVFSIQRTHKAFNARRQCKDRTYHYHLPGHLLGLTGSEADAPILERLKSCLDQFVGTHPFHNYTYPVHQYYCNASGCLDEYQKLRQERARYRRKNLQREKAKALELWQQHSLQRSLTEADGQAQEPLRNTAESVDVTLPSFGSADADQTVKPAKQISVQGRQRVRWLEKASDWDELTRSHYRTIQEASASQPWDPNPETGELYLTITFRGASFMVYQVRHMVATAVCAAKGLIPLELVRVSLCKQARAQLPLAPALGLVLAGSSFFDFPVAGTGQAAHPVAELSGTSLSLRKEGEARQTAFFAQTLLPVLRHDLNSAIWQDWSEELAAHTQYRTEELSETFQAYAAWKAGDCAF